jgi:hypothetical protein
VIRLRLNVNRVAEQVNIAAIPIATLIGDLFHYVRKAAHRWEVRLYPREVSTHRVASANAVVPDSGNKLRRDRPGRGKRRVKVKWNWRA